mgnify:FL=1
MHGVTLEECFCGRKPSKEHLKVFGGLAYAHVPTKLRSKPNPKAKTCIFVGYSEEQKGYRCYKPLTRKVVVSRDVIFDELGSWCNPKPNAEVNVENENEEENEFGSGRISSENVKAVGQQSPTSMTCNGPSEGSSSKTKLNEWSGKNVEKEKYDKKGKQKMPEYEMLDEESKNVEDAYSDVSMDEELGILALKTPGVKKAMKEAIQKLRRSTREKKSVERFGYDTYMAMHYAYMSKVVKLPDPTSFEEAKDEKKWVIAMQEEMDALAENKTWDLVKLPREKNVVGCKWVYKTKHDSDGNVSRHKARLVAKGYAQMQGVDYDETYAPVAKMATIRTLLAIGAAKGWFLHHMDVKNAFLHGNLEEEVYMCQPPGFENKKHPEFVCKLKKALYGLKQAPRAWHQTIAEFLINIGFKVSKADTSLYGRGLMVT